MTSKFIEIVEITKIPSYFDVIVIKKYNDKFYMEVPSYNKIHKMAIPKGLYYQLKNWEESDDWLRHIQ